MLAKTNPKKKDHSKTGSFSNNHFRAFAKERTLIKIPKNNRIQDFGFLPYKKMKYFFNALDTAIICNADSLFLSPRCS